MHLAARYLREPSDDDLTPDIEFTLPDGRHATSADPDIDTVLSAAVGHTVRLFPLHPADDLDHYRRGPADSDDLDVELRAIFDRLEDEPLPDFSVFPPEILEFESPPGTYVDAFRSSSSAKPRCARSRRSCLSRPSTCAASDRTW